MANKPKSKFEKLCEEVADKTGVSFYSPWSEPGIKPDVYEDDGCLHIQRRGIHGCFNVSNGQNLSGKDQNERTKAVLTALGLEKFITDRVLVDETEEDDEDTCPHCGHDIH